MECSPWLFPLFPASVFGGAPSRAASYLWSSGLQPDHPTLVPGELVARSWGTETPQQWKVPSGSLETLQWGWGSVPHPGHDVTGPCGPWGHAGGEQSTEVLQSTRRVSPFPHLAPVT